MSKNIFAYTSLERIYPTFISVNADENTVEFTIRSSAVDGKCGETSMIKLTNKQAAQLAYAIINQAPSVMYLEQKEHRLEEKD